MPTQWIIFTDLDGTLLDQSDYSWKPAVPALNLARQASIPMVICSSKTRAEIEKIRGELCNHDPFISENGGGIFIPDGYFTFPFPYDQSVPGYKIIELGTPYVELRKALRTLSEETGIPVVGYGDLSVREIAAQTGLSQAEAVLAKQREYDEPFIIEGSDQQREKFLLRVQAHGLHYTRGGRYYHLTGNNDKGIAVRRLRGLFEEKFGKITTIGLGDHLNDLPMLNAVDYPVLIRQPNGNFSTDLKSPRRVIVPGSGPAGWNNAVLKLLARMKD